MAESRRYLGLELSGAKNQKTSLAVLEFYPRGRKIFLLDTYDRIASHDHQSSDDALLELIREVKPGVAKMGVNVPLELPPCISCIRKTCPLPEECSVPSVKWMREFHRKNARNKSNAARNKDFTPYTQRPIELWVKHHVFAQIPENIHFEIDETLGGNRAPLSARMNFLKRHLKDISLVEVWPKLTTSILTHRLGLHRRTINSYRHLEEGAHAREEILHAFARHLELFVYERDMRKLSQSLNSFDAFICALTAWLSDQDDRATVPKGFPVSSGWIEYPVLDTLPDPLFER